MLKPELQAALNEQLEDSEKLLWSDQPTRQNIRDLVLVLLCGVIIGAIGFGFLLTTNVLLEAAPWQGWDWQKKLEFGVSSVALAFVCAFSASLLYFVIRSHRLTLYAVTDKRLLILIMGRRGQEVSSYWQQGLVGLRHDHTNKDTGSLGVYYEGAWRSGFGHIRNASSVESLILDTFKLQKNTPQRPLENSNSCMEIL